MLTRTSPAGSLRKTGADLESHCRALGSFPTPLAVSAWIRTETSQPQCKVGALGSPQVSPGGIHCPDLKAQNFSLSSRIWGLRRRSEGLGLQPPNQSGTLTMCQEP